MHRKLYALLVLLGTFSGFVLLYLYFFVYYTATVVISSNVSDYRVEFFSKTTAQKRVQICPEEICEILDVSPFDYNITVSKDDYESELIATKIQARKRQEFFVELEKKARLEEILDFTATETAKQKIERLREENLYVASFALGSESKITFSGTGEKMQMQYRTKQEIRDIAYFIQVPDKDIYAEYIDETKKIFLQIGKISYIFELQSGKLHTLPFEIVVKYIKPTLKANQYLVVTEKGTFLYDTLTKNSEFLYLFRDFVYFQDALIGVIYSDETEKKKNFDLTQNGNLVMYYTPEDKRRKVLLATDLKIDRIELQGEKVIVSTGKTQFELKNF